MPGLRAFDLVVHGARAGSDALRDAVADLRRAGHRVRVHVTWERGDARRLARHAADRVVRRGAGAVVAVGGDGTLNEVLNGVLLASPTVGAPAPIGVIPVGTANDFARQAGIPSDPGAALALAAAADPVPVDVGRVNGRAFLNVSTLGAPAEVTSETSASSKQALGVFAYALSGVRRFVTGDEPVTARVSGPGFARELPFLFVAVGNARATGAGTVVTPLAEVDDGLLDVCVVEPVARLSYAGLLLELRRGEHLDREGVHYVQTPWLRVEAAEPLAANVDGEPIRARTLRYDVEPLAARVFVAPPAPEPDA